MRGLRAEPEGAHPVVEAPGAQALADHDRADVARLREDPGGVERLPAAVLGVVDRAVGDLDLRRQVERRRRRHRAVLERTRDGERLERRARLVGEADGAVLERPRGRGARLVGVDARPVGHREDLAGARVHDDRGRALGPVGLADALRAPPRCAPGAARRASGAAARRGRPRCTSRTWIVWRPPSRTERCTPSLPCSSLSRAYSSPNETLAVDADGADHLRGQHPARVGAQRAGREVDAGDPERLDAIGDRGGHAAAEVDEAGVAAREFPRQLVDRDAEQRRDPRGGADRVLDEVRGRRDVVGGLGGGERHAPRSMIEPRRAGQRLLGDLLRATRRSRGCRP